MKYSGAALIVVSSHCHSTAKQSEEPGMTRSIPLRRAAGWIGDASVRFLERADPAHIVIAQLEIEHVDILRDPLRIRRTRYCRDDVLLHQPAQRYLRKCLAGTLCDLGQHRLVDQTATGQRTI